MLENAHNCTLLYNKYRVRYYVLVMFSLVGFLQAVFWNLWGPISEIAQLDFHWNMISQSLLPNWGPIMFIIFLLPLSILLYFKGLRISMLLASGLMALGAVMRCLPGSNFTRTMLIHSGAILNGITGVLVLMAPPVVSAVWFPPDERTMSTAIAVTMNTLGMAFSFVIGPLALFGPAAFRKHTNSSISMDILHQRVDMLLYVEAGVSVGFFAVCLFFLPAKPPLPPCVAIDDRLSLKQSIKCLYRNKQFFIAMAMFSISMGVFCAYLGVLPTLLLKLKISETVCDQIGFGSLGLAGIGTVTVGFVGDKLGRRVPQRCLLLVMAFAAAWNAVLALGLVVHDTLSLFTSQCLLAFGVLGGSPLWYESACETGYPAVEELVGGLLAFGLNVTMSLCLCATLIPNLGLAWLPAFMSVIFFFLIPLGFAFNEGTHTRRQADDLACSQLSSYLHMSSSLTNCPGHDGNDDSCLTAKVAALSTACRLNKHCFNENELPKAGQMYGSLNHEPRVFNICLSKDQSVNEKSPLPSNSSLCEDNMSFNTPNATGSRCPLTPPLSGNSSVCTDTASELDLPVFRALLGTPSLAASHTKSIVPAESSSDRNLSRSAGAEEAVVMSRDVKVE